MIVSEVTEGLSKAGKVLKEWGAWGALTIMFLAFMIVPRVFSGDSGQIERIQVALDKQAVVVSEIVVAVSKLTDNALTLARAVEEHIHAPTHGTTSTSLATISAQLVDVLRRLDKIESKIERP